MIMEKHSAVSALNKSPESVSVSKLARSAAEKIAETSDDTMARKMHDEYVEYVAEVIASILQDGDLFRAAAIDEAGKVGQLMNAAQESGYRAGVEAALKMMDKRFDIPPGGLLIESTRKVYRDAIASLIPTTTDSQEGEVNE
jgi:hypothetical protein